MKQMKRAFAMLLCVAMVLSLCMTFTVAEDIPIYSTLDDIPEDFKVFRSIRTGEPIYHEQGDYYEFHQDGYPKVGIKRSAFLTAPTNAYLIADNLALSKNCKNADGTTRVCYYKTMTVSSHDPRLLDSPTKKGQKFNTYTTSMYRLVLSADADCNAEIMVEAKLTSGVTFEYDTEKAPYWALKPKDKEPLRPNVAVAVAKNSQDVRLKKYRFEDSFGFYSNVSAKDAENAGISGASCLKSVYELWKNKDGKSLSDTILACAPTVVEYINYSPEQHYHSEVSMDYPTNMTPIVTSPVKLGVCEHFVRVLYTLNTSNYDKSKVDFIISFGFD